MKATTIAPANIAFIKYWGKTNDRLTLPNNTSVSMNLDSLTTKTTVEFDESLEKDRVEIAYYGSVRIQADSGTYQRVVEQLDRIRKLSKLPLKAKVVSENTFPAGVGIASSASAFCALTLATVKASGLKLNTKELTILTRLGGSGSACRSIPNGFVEWKKGHSSQTSYAVSLEQETHWHLYDVILVVSDAYKKVSSLEGHALAHTSPYYATRLRELRNRTIQVKKGIHTKNLTMLGIASQQDAISLHCIAMTSNPPIFYWLGGTMSIINEVYRLQSLGVSVYFTIDAGPNVHLLCEEGTVEFLQQNFSTYPFIQQIFVAKAGKGARYSEEHLF